MDAEVKVEILRYFKYLNIALFRADANFVHIMYD